MPAPRERPIIGHCMRPSVARSAALIGGVNLLAELFVA
jgi:hypothetical protein